MTKKEIMTYLAQRIVESYPAVQTESGEIVAEEGKDGLFVGTVRATLFSALPNSRQVYAAIGETKDGLSLVRLGRSDCVNPDLDKLDFLLEKELGVKPSEDRGSD